MDTLRTLTIATVVCSVLAVLGLVLWEVSPYNASPLPHAPGWFGFPAWSLFGLALFISFVTLSVDLVNQCMTHYHQKYWQEFLTGRSGGKARNVWFSLVAQGVMARVYLLIAVAIGFTWARDVMRCGVFFCLGDPSTYAPAADAKAYKGDIINTVIGLFIILTFYPMSIVLIIRIFLLTKKLRSLQKQMRASREAEEVTVVNPDADQSAVAATNVGGQAHTSVVPPVSPVADVTRDPADTQARLRAVVSPEKIESMRFYVPPTTARQALTLSLVLLLVVVCMLLGFYYLNDLHRLTAQKVAEFAAETVSVEGVKNATSSVPEGPHAFFRTRVWSLTNRLRFKTFPGNFFLYTYLIVVLVVVWGLRQSQKGSYWMQRRVPQFPALNYVEAGLAAATAVLTVLFFVYWAHDHNYKSVWTNTVDSATVHFPTREIFARAMGQVTALFLSLLLLPVSRHSVLHNVLGTSWESFLCAHRFLGYMFLVAMVVHALAYFSVFSLYGQLWHNFFVLPPIIGYREVSTDFTVVLMEWWLGPLVLVCMGGGAYWKVRRQLFEVFHYAHLFASYALLGITLLHAPSSWQYMLPGLTLWLIDRFIRLFQRSALVDVGSARIVSEDIFEVGFRIRGGTGPVMNRAYPGQYVFMNVVEVSALQWHPFTLSSAAGLGATRASAPYTVHIKSMGPGTWTQKLYDRVARGEPITLAVEGPCGSPLDVSRLDELFLVCGGIGVTPCASIFGSVLRWARAQARGEAAQGQEAAAVTLPRRVRLIWACRSAPLVQAMAPTLGLPAYLHTDTDAEALGRDETREANVMTGWSSSTDFEVCLSVTSAPDFAALARLKELKDAVMAAPAAGDDVSTTPYVDGAGLREGSLADEPLPGIDEQDGQRVQASQANPVAPFFTTTSIGVKDERGTTASLNETSSDVDGSAVVRLADICAVRPNLREALCPTGDPMRCMVMVCGPAELVKDTIAAYVELSLPLRAEEFEL